jgi:hypothetical protein
MRFPPKSYNKDLESAEDRREREAQVRFVPVQLFPPSLLISTLHTSRAVDPDSFNPDPDKDPAFQVNSDMDPETIRIQGFDDHKLKKKNTA